MQRPHQNEFPTYFSKYIGLVKGNNLHEAIQIHAKEIIDFYNQLPNEKANYAYAPNKWSITDVLQHVVDTERVFTYRALIVARKSNAILSGFDENEFATQAALNNVQLEKLKQELIASRQSSDLFFTSLSNETLSNVGVANNNPITVNALGFMNLGHFLHHKNVLLERYL
jgi:uncharacterized damage-inducible protein DinB